MKMNENSSQQSYWQEMGRWTGYEETYDVEAGRWGPSHISYLTFKSLVQLRRTMNTGENKKKRLSVHQSSGQINLQTHSVCFLIITKSYT